MFDPYHKWLGIPPKDQPPNYYRLLAIDVFESDTEVIDAAANRQMAYVQQRATGEHMAESQKLLNELSTARLCLLDQKKKAQYDLQLKIDLRRQSRRAGETGIKQPKGAKSPGLKTAASLAEQALTQLPGKIIPPPVQDQPTEEDHFSLLPLPRTIFLVLGGIFLLVAVLITSSVVMSRGNKHDETVIKRTIDAKGGTTASDNTAEPGSRIRKPPQSVGNSVIDVEIDPPQAILMVKNNAATITGSGRLRQIRLGGSWSDNVLVIASCDGYENYTRSLAITPGRNEKLIIEMQKIASGVSSNGGPTTPGADPGANTVRTPSNGTGASGPRGTANPPPRIISPLDVRGENPARPVEQPKPISRKMKVYAFSGESAIETPVQRTLPSTVEAWIKLSKPSENSDMYVFGSDDIKSTTGGLGVHVGKDGLLGGRRISSNKKLRDFWTPVFLPLDKWTHLAVTFDKDQFRFFVDGRPVFTDKGSQKTGAAVFVVGYIGVGQYNPAYTFVGNIRTVRISSGIRYDDDFQPPVDFNKNQDKEDIKTVLIYDAASGKVDPIPDISGNKKEGRGYNITIKEEEIPDPNS